MLLDDLTKVGKGNGLSGFKVPKDIHVEIEIDGEGNGFTIDNECLTPSQKLKRPQIFKRYKNNLREMYAGQGQTKLGPTFEEK